MSPPGDDAILAELVAHARRHPERQLLQFESLLGGRQYRRLYRLIGRFAEPGARVLDWGAGNGHFSYYLLRAGYRAEGFTLVPTHELAWLLGSGYVLTRGDPSEPVRLPYPDGSFDVVASIGVLEHVRETGGSEDRSLREIARILRGGGTFICYHFPNRWSWIDWAARRVPGCHRHDDRYTKRDIARLAGEAALEVLALGRYGLLPRNWGGRLPRFLATSRALAATWDALDALLAVPLARFC